MCKLLMCFLYSRSARYILKIGTGRRASENWFGMCEALLQKQAH